MFELFKNIFNNKNLGTLVLKTPFVQGQQPSVVTVKDCIKALERLPENMKVVFIQSPEVSDYCFDILDDNGNPVQTNIRLH